jgi:methionyl-tRNA formyltransferase
MCGSTVKIVFFGTPRFAAQILSDCIAAGYTIVGVVTKPDKPKGRALRVESSEVKLEAEKLLPGVPCYQPLKCSSLEMAAILKELDADLFVVVAFGEIISQAILDIPRLGCINIHASLLPKYRGAAPIQRVLLAGEKETGISIIRMVRKMDAGEILYSEKIAINPNTTFGELEQELCKLATTCLFKAIGLIETNNVALEIQDESLVTFADKIGPAECFIDWTQTAQTIHNQVRALSPHPGAFTFVLIRGERKRLKVLRTEVVSEATLNPKSTLISKTAIIVGCTEGALSLQTIQLEGKPAMAVSDFLKGTPQLEFA